MIGIPFQSVGGESISVQDLIPDPLGQGLSGAMMAALSVNADQIGYWDDTIQGNYVYLYLCNMAGAKRNKWCVMTGDAFLTPEAKAKWGTYDTASPAKLDPGMGLWFKRRNYAAPKTITMSGQVIVAQTGVTVTLKPGFNMFSGGYTTPFAPNIVASGTGDTDFDWLGNGVNGAMMAALAVNADQIGYWDPTVQGNYIYLYLCNMAGAKRNKWCVMTGDAFLTPEAKAKWGAYDTVSPVVIPAGRGVWFKRKAGSPTLTLTLPQPYSL